MLLFERPGFPSSRAHTLTLRKVPSDRYIVLAASAVLAAGHSSRMSRYVDIVKPGNECFGFCGFCLCSADAAPARSDRSRTAAAKEHRRNSKQKAPLRQQQKQAHKPARTCTGTGTCAHAPPHTHTQNHKQLKYFLLRSTDTRSPLQSPRSSQTRCP